MLTILDDPQSRTKHTHTQTELVQFKFTYLPMINLMNRWTGTSTIFVNVTIYTKGIGCILYIDNFDAVLLIILLCILTKANLKIVQFDHIL